MLTEEAHHMFVGESGMGRIMERTCQLLKESGFSGDVRKAGGIDLPLIQKFVNFWFSQSLDLHGSEVSSNAAAYFSNGLKGRAEEDKFDDDHVLAANLYMLDMIDDSGRIIRQEVPMRNALNEVLRDWYVGDCQAGVDRWNKRILEPAGMSDRIALPSRKFNRKVGVYAGKHFDPMGNTLTTEEWERKKYEWLPSLEDKKYLHSIQVTPVYKPASSPTTSRRRSAASIDSRSISNMSARKLRTAVADGVLTITLDDPPANTYSYEMMQELDAAILAARMDAAVHVIVLTGAGEKFFCAGANIGTLKDADPTFKYYFCLHANETLNRLEQTPKLVIAALNGHTVGGGLEVAMAADIRIARQGAGKIGMPEVASACCPAPAARSASRAWSAKPGRSS
jgi:hypothetical protein